MNLPTPDPQEAREKQLARLLVDVNAQDLSALRVALTQQDAKAITHHAHRVRGAALVVQESELEITALALEEASCIRPPDWQTLSDLIETLSRNMDACRNRLGL